MDLLRAAPGAEIVHSLAMELLPETPAPRKSPAFSEAMQIVKSDSSVSRKPKGCTLPGM